MMIPRLRALCSASVLMYAVGCASDSVVTPKATAPRPSAAAASSERTLAIELEAPVRGDAGLILSIEGPNIRGVVPAPGFDVVATAVSSHGRGRIDVLVTGPLRSGVIAWLAVQGVHSGQPYDATIIQVATGASEGFAQRRDLNAYTVAVR